MNANTANGFHQNKFRLPLPFLVTYKLLVLLLSLALGLLLKLALAIVQHNSRMNAKFDNGFHQTKFRLPLPFLVAYKILLSLLSMALGLLVRLTLAIVRPH